MLTCCERRKFISREKETMCEPVNPDCMTKKEIKKDKEEMRAREEGEREEGGVLLS